MVTSFIGIKVFFSQKSRQKRKEKEKDNGTEIIKVKVINIEPHLNLRLCK
jgi:hypothetical protein